MHACARTPPPPIADLSSYSPLGRSLVCVAGVVALPLSLSFSLSFSFSLSRPPFSFLSYRLINPDTFSPQILCFLCLRFPFSAVLCSRLNFPHFFALSHVPPLSLTLSLLCGSRLQTAGRHHPVRVLYRVFLFALFFSFLHSVVFCSASFG